MDQETLLRIGIFLGIFLLVSAPVHECAHAFTAWRLGDGTAKLFGRVSLNPIVHFDPIGTLAIVLSSYVGFGLGWAKPTPVNPYNLRGRHAESLVAAAGPISNLLLAAIFAALWRIIPDTAYGLQFYDRTPLGIASLICWYGVSVNVALMIFNLIPVPPLDGSHVLLDFVDPLTAVRLRPIFDQYGLFLLFFLLFPIFGNQSIAGIVFDRVGTPILSLLLGIPLV